MSEERKGGSFAGGFFLGMLAGGILAYVVIQEEARDMIIGKAREASNFARDATGDLRSNASDLYARGKGVVDNARANIDAAVDEGQSTADRIRDDLSGQP